MLGEHQLQIPPGLDIIAPKPRQILDQHNLEPVLLHVAEHSLKARAIKTRARPAIIHVFPDDSEPVLCRIPLQQAALILDALAFAGIVVIAAEP